METAQPTPHDIIPPPGVPYSPSLIEWLCLLLITVIILLCTTFLLQKLKKKEKRPTGTPEEKILRLFEKCKSGTINIQQANTLARLLRRYISLAESVDITGYTKKELEQYVQTTNDTQLGALLVALIQLEEVRYRQFHGFEASILESLLTTFTSYANKGATA